MSNLDTTMNINRDNNMETMKLLPVHRSKHNITMNATIGDMFFSSSYWYEGLDLYELEDMYGFETLEKIYFHIALFEMNKLFCLKPKYLDLGIYEKYRTAELDRMVDVEFYDGYSQWRYENDEPWYHGPQILGEVHDLEPTPVKAGEPLGCELLALNGGGKDSLVSMLLFEQLGLEFDTLGYSCNIYGQAEHQHQLINQLVKGHGIRHHKVWQYDQFMDCPVVELLGEERGIKTLLSDESTQSAFSILLTVLKYGYRYINLGHELSAEQPNLIWDITGLPINHQWCKSTAWEVLVCGYIEKYLVSNCHFFSNLKPVNDVVIFNTLRDGLKFVPLTHSCNLTKPWCKRCPKCAYVWLSYMAYLPMEMINEMFKSNLLDTPENQIFFRQMLGLEDQTPFECLGTIGECKLAFELCYKKGLRGKFMDVYLAEVRGKFDPQEAAIELSEVDESYAILPSYIRNGLMSLLAKKRDTSREYIKSVLKSGNDVDKVYMKRINATRNLKAEVHCAVNGISNGVNGAY